MLVGYHLKGEKKSHIVDVGTDSVHLAFAEVKEYAGRANIERMLALVVDNKKVPTFVDFDDSPILA